MLRRELGSNGDLSKSQRRFLSVAMSVAENSDGNYRHGAVLVKSGRIISFAPNLSKNNPRIFMDEFPDDKKMQQFMVREHCSTHAEEKVVKLAREHARGATVFIARINRKGEPMMSKPCHRCEQILIAAGVKAVVYTETYSNFMEGAVA